MITIRRHKEIKKTLFIFGTLLLVAIGILSISLSIFLETQEKHAILEQKIQSQRSLNELSRESVERLSDYSPLFKSHIDKGIIGLPNRLQWAETIYNIASGNNQSEVVFTLRKTEVIDAIDPLYTDGITIRKTPMTIFINSAHEGIVYDFFNDLKQQANGVFLIDECSIEYVDKKSSNINVFYPIKTQCLLNWYTIENTVQQNIGMN